jgi:hypothetical protein
VNPRASLGALEKRKNSCPAGNRTPAVQPVSISTELFRLRLLYIRNLNVSKYTATCYNIDCSFYVISEGFSLLIEPVHEDIRENESSLIFNLGTGLR